MEVSLVGNDVYYTVILPDSYRVIAEKSPSECGQLSGDTPIAKVSAGKYAIYFNMFYKVAKFDENGLQIPFTELYIGCYGNIVYIARFDPTAEKFKLVYKDKFGSKTVNLSDLVRKIETKLRSQTQ